MDNFEFYNPVKINFGKETIAQLATEVPQGSKVLIVYGGGSIKKNGVYEQVKSALKSFEVLEFGGIEANPTYETCMKAVEVIKQKGINFIVAVGGGSVIDGTKFIAAAAKFSGEPWDILEKWAPVTEAIPYGTVLTLPATGSEMNMGSVISKKETQDKLFFKSPLVYPRFSILDPEVTYSLPERQVANGVIDAFVHTMEQYLTYPAQAPIQDGFSEVILKTLIEDGPKALSSPKDYDVRATVMWSATMALNGLIGVGVPQDWATHMIGHELTALYGLDHAVTLAIILPVVMDYKKEQKREKILRYAKEVLGITKGNNDQIVDEAIAKTREFFESMGVKTRLSQYEGISKTDIPRLVEKLEEHGRLQLGEHLDIDLEDSRSILEKAF